MARCLLYLIDDALIILKCGVKTITIVFSPSLPHYYLAYKR